MSDDIRHEYTVRSTRLLISAGDLLRALDPANPVANIGDALAELRRSYGLVMQTLSRATASDLVSDLERDALLAGLQSLATDGDR